MGLTKFPNCSKRSNDPRSPCHLSRLKRLLRHWRTISRRTWEDGLVVKFLNNNKLVLIYLYLLWKYKKRFVLERSECHPFFLSLNAYPLFLQDLYTWDRGNALTYPIRYHEIGYNLNKQDKLDADFVTGVDVSTTQPPPSQEYPATWNSSRNWIYDSNWKQD